MKLYTLVSIHEGKLFYLTERGKLSHLPQHAIRRTRYAVAEVKESLGWTTMGPFAIAPAPAREARL